MTNKKDKNSKKTLSRYVDGIYTKRDAQSILNNLIRDSDADGIWEEQMDKVWRNAMLLSTSPEKERAYEKEAKVLLKTLKRPGMQINGKFFFKAAAIIIVLIIISVSTYTLKKGMKKDITYSTLQVKNGQQNEIILEDGTKILLNAGTTLYYPKQFSRKERTIRLDGEAFLEVAKDLDRPFIVETADATIKVLGTSFNLKTYEEDQFITVTVESGKVEVELEKATMLLESNEHLYYDKTDNIFTKTNESPEKSKAWISGGIYFNRTPIYQVLNELRRRFNCVIEFEKESDMIDEFFYGAYNGDNLETILNAIIFSTEIKYKKVRNEFILYK